MQYLRQRPYILALLVLIGGGLFLGKGPTAANASAEHPSVAEELPRRDTPIVIDGDVWKSIQVHDRIIVAGEFDRVQTVRNGPIVERENIFAYDINTGAIIDDFAPEVNGRINEMVADPDGGGFYLGGVFSQIDGEFRIRLARINYDGTLDNSFRPEVSAAVHTIDVHEDIVYFGGSFLTVNDEAHSNIAAVDATNGDLIDGFDLNVAGNLGKEESRSVRTVEVHPNGNLLLVVSNGQQLIDRVRGDDDRFGVAFVNLNTFTVTPWRTQWFENAFERCSAGSLQIREASFSPDGSQFAIGEKGGFTCDKIVMFNTVDDGVNNPAWVTAAHDSVFSVEVTNNAVYAGGHFCYVAPHGQVTSAEAPTYPWVIKPEPCNIGAGNQDVDGVAARQQIVALDPATGEVLDWNPKSNAVVGVFDIESIDRGLLLGQDADRLNQIQTGRHAFLDFGGTTPVLEQPLPDPDVPSPELPATGCVGTLDNGEVALAWADNNVSTFVVRRDDAWVATVEGANTFAATGAGDYVIRFRSNGVVTDLPCAINNIFPPAPEPVPTTPIDQIECTTTLANGELTLTWSNNDASSQVIRRNGRWRASVSSFDTSYSTETTTGDYLVRLRFGGEVVDVLCVPQPNNPGPVTNRALGKEATQSSTGFGGVAELAVDGNTSGVFRQRSVTHTSNERQPWWQVDLGASGDIDNVELWNRTDTCCTSRLSNVVVFVSSRDMSGRSLADLEGDPSVESFSVAGGLAETTTIDTATTGRYVRVQLRGTSALSLAEVVVNG